jgi:hypothetical protein
MTRLNAHERATANAIRARLETTHPRCAPEKHCSFCRPYQAELDRLERRALEAEDRKAEDAR